VAVDSDHQVIVSNQPSDVEHLMPMLQRIGISAGSLPTVITKGSRIDAQHMAIVEPLNGQIQAARGLRRFLLRGLEKVDAKWHLKMAPDCCHPQSSCQAQAVGAHVCAAGEAGSQGAKSPAKQPSRIAWPMARVKRSRVVRLWRLSRVRPSISSQRMRWCK